RGDGFNVEAVYTPGHISNHLCFAVKEDNALLSGDHVMGWSTAVISPPDGNMADYFASLRKLLPREEALFIPTHGAEIRNPVPFVQAYIEHRLGREAQIMARLKEGPQTIPAMVAKNYADTPAHLPAAAGRARLAHPMPARRDARGGPSHHRLPVSSVGDVAMDRKLPGKTVRISGGSGGIGFACAMAFAGEGCAVHIASRSKQSLEAARDKIRGRHNVPVEIHVADFSKGDTVRSVIDAVGHADILVNNAGAIPRGDILAMTEPKWREAWELKVFGYINATRAMLEKMYARKKGAVVNIIGLAGESYNYDYVTGTMGNASLMAFTRAVGSKS